MAFRFFEQWSEALDGKNLVGQLRQHGCLITAASPDFQCFSQRWTAIEQQLDHPGDNVGLGNSLSHAERQGSIFIGTGGESLLDKDMARHGGHRRQYRFMADAFFTQALDHPRPRPLRGHPDTTKHA